VMTYRNDPGDLRDDRNGSYIPPYLQVFYDVPFLFLFCLWFGHAGEQGDKVGGVGGSQHGLEWNKTRIAWRSMSGERVRGARSKEPPGTARRSSIHRTAVSIIRL